MDQTYDSLAAKLALSNYITDYFKIHAENSTDSRHLATFKSEDYQVCSFGSPKVYKLAKVSNEVQEAIFVVHGIVIEKELPPIQLQSQPMHDERSKQRYAGYLRQYVTIMGLGCEEFNGLLKGLARVHRYFTDNLPPNKLQPLDPLHIHGQISMASHARYFQACWICPSAAPFPFGPGVDPNRELEQLMGCSYIHTEDNVVQYLSKTVSEGKLPKYANLNPIRLQKGDIVELSISLICVQTRFNDFKMLTSLKAIALIDDKFREKAWLDGAKNLLVQKVEKIGLKCRFVEMEDDHHADHIKHARMDWS